MSHVISHEIPSDDEVCSVLQAMGGGTTRTLLNELVKCHGHDSRDSQRAIMRCIDRGRIVMGEFFHLEVARERELVDA